LEKLGWRKEKGGVGNEIVSSNFTGFRPYHSLKKRKDNTKLQNNHCWKAQP